MPRDIRHSSKNERWLTPPDIIARAYEVFGGPPDFDPASSDDDNIFVQARRILTKGDDALVTPWNCNGLSVWMNPPGGTRGHGQGSSQTGLFWARLMEHYPGFKHAIVIGFNLELLRHSQNYSPISAMQFPFVVPRERTPFWRYNPDTGILEEGKQPGHPNVFVYVPGTENHTDRFVAAFEGVGDLIIPR